MINLSSKEATDTHRQLIGSMNGLAGVHILNKDFPAAVEEYREVIRSIESHVDRLHTDSLQQLHTYHNLNWILTTVKPEGVGPTLRDDKLVEQVNLHISFYAVRLFVPSFSCWLIKTRFPSHSCL